MSKKQKRKHKKYPIRNAAAPARPAAAPRAVRAPKQPHDETPLKRLGYTAAGAAGMSLAGSFLIHEGWAPKTIATALGAVGAGLAWKGDAPAIRSIGAGVMSAAGSQLALLMLDEHKTKTPQETPPPSPPQKRANAGELPPGSLENAFERAKVRLAMASGEPVGSMAE
jgi:hypothetical protein